MENGKGSHSRLPDYKIKRLFRYLTIVLSVFAVVIISYALLLPANTLEHGTINAEYDQIDEKTFSLTVQASAGEEKEKSYFTFVYDPTQIQMDIVFDEDHESVIQDKYLSTVTIHEETVVTDTNETKDTYWFVLNKGNETEFTISWVFLSDTLPNDLQISYGFSYTLQDSLKDADQEENMIAVKQDNSSDVEAVADDSADDSSTPENTSVLSEESSVQAAEETTGEDITSKANVRRSSKRKLQRTEIAETQDEEEIETYNFDKVENATDLSPYIKSVSLSKYQNGKWIDSTEFTEGDEVLFEMEYIMDAGIVTVDNNAVIYQLPNGITPVQAEVGKVKQNGSDVGEYRIDQSGKIIIIFNPSFATSESFTGDLQFIGTVSNTGTGDRGTIQFAGTGQTITIKKDAYSDQYDLSTAKTATVDKANNKVTYTVTASSTKGTVSTVTIKDELKSDSTCDPKYESGSFVIKKISNETETVITENYKVNLASDLKSFTIADLPQLQANEAYVVTYSVDAGESTKTDGSRSVINAVTSASGQTNRSAWVTTEVSKPMVDKVGSYNDKTGKIVWTITVNQDHQNIGGWKLDDVLTPVNGTAIQTPASFTVTEINSNGTETTYIKSDMPHTFANGDTNMYRIIYEVDAPQSDEKLNVTNTAKLSKDTTEYSSTKTVQVQKRTSNVYKEARSNVFASGSECIRDITWNSVITIPAGKLTSFTYTDTLGNVTNNNNEMVADGDTRHYAFVGELDEKLKANLKLYYYEYNDQGKIIDGAKEIGFENDLVTFTIKYKDINGKAIEENDTVTHVRSFTITITPKDSTNIEAYQFITGDYITHADYTDIPEGSTWKVTNTANAYSTDKTAVAEYTKPKPITKRIYSKDEYGNSEYREGSETIEYGADGKLYYEVLLDYTQIDKNNDIIVTDTLPEGMELVEGSVTVHYYFSKYYLPQADAGNVDVSVGEKNPQNQTPVTITIHKKIFNVNLNLSTMKAIGLHYAVDVNEDTYWDSLKNTEKTYTNIVQWNNDTASQTTTVLKDQPAVSKTAEQLTDENGNLTDKVKYTVVINPTAEDLYEPSDELTLVDTLSWTSDVKDAVLDLAGTKLYEYDPDQSDLIAKDENDHYKEINSDRYSIKFDQIAHTMTARIPDNVACVLVYTYTFDLVTGQTPSISNDVTLNGIWESDISTEVEASSSAATADRGSVTINKVDSEDYQKKLSGSKFKIEYFYWNGSSWGQWQPINYAWDGIEEGETVPTDGIYELKNGSIKFDSSTAEASEGYSSNTIYRITEIQAPDNYSLDETPTYVVMMEQDQTAAETAQAISQQVNYINSMWGNTHKIYLATDGINEQNINYFSFYESSQLYIENENKSITVTKAWIDSSGKDLINHPDSVQVQLKQSTARLSGYTVKFTTKGSVWKDWQEKEYQYAGGTVDCGNEIIVEKGSKLVIQADDWGGAGKYYIVINESEKIPITESSGYGQYQTYTIDSVTKDLSITLIDEHGYDASSWLKYYITYEAPASYETTSRANYGDLKTLNADNNWTAEWNDLPATDKSGNTYFYTVEEVIPSGYTVSYTNNNGIQKGNILITNKLANFSFPETGGTGTTLYTTGGLILMAVSILLCAYKKYNSESLKERVNKQ